MRGLRVKLLAASLLLLACGALAPVMGQTSVAPCTTILQTNGNPTCQPVTAAAPLPVTDVSGASGGLFVGGYEFNSNVIPVVQNGSYSQGQSEGGLQTISIGKTNGITGILTGVFLSSKGGSTNAIAVYVWQKNPVNSTCTDKTNFASSQVDNENLLTGFPVLVTPALGLGAQDTITYANLTNYVSNFVNGNANTSLYVCLVTNATVTPASVSDLSLNIAGTKDQP